MTPSCEFHSRQPRETAAAKSLWPTEDVRRRRPGANGRHVARIAPEESRCVDSHDANDPTFGRPAGHWKRNVGAECSSRRWRHGGQHTEAYRGARRRLAERHAARLNVADVGEHRCPPLHEPLGRESKLPLLEPKHGTPSTGE